MMATLVGIVRRATNILCSGFPVEELLLDELIVINGDEEEVYNILYDDKRWPRLA